MIRPIKIKLNAAHPELPLVEATTFVGSPSTVFVCDVPKAVGSWRISTVKVVATYPDNSAPTVECVKGADGVYMATLPATATSGRVTHGFEVLADAIDENGDPVTGYVLGFADFAVYLRDMTIEGAEGVKYYAHLVDSIPEHPKKGDLANFDGVYKLYNGEAWISLGADIAAQYAEEARLAKVAAETAQGKAEAAEAGAVNAKIDAVAAKTAAENAKVDAIAAKGSAEAASEAAVLAKTAAETAQTKAETAQGKAEAAQTAAEAATSTKVTIDPVFENTMSEIFSMDTDLAECATTQDVAIMKLSQLLGEDVSAYAVPAAA